MKFIRELNEDVEVLIEESEGVKKFFIEGVFLQADVKNRNRRFYPKSIMEKAVGTYITEFVNRNRAIGELNHPTSPKVNPERASHLITEMKWMGNNVIGKAKVLNTPQGNIVRGLIEEGVQLGVSSRGLGSLKEMNGYHEVQDDFMINCVDCVFDPSAPDAFVDGIMENVEWIYEGDILVQKKAEETKETIKKLSLKELNEQKISLLENFFKNL